MGTLKIEIIFRHHFSIVPHSESRTDSDSRCLPKDPIALIPSRNRAPLEPENRNPKGSGYIVQNFKNGILRLGSIDSNEPSGADHPTDDPSIDNLDVVKQLSSGRPRKYRVHHAGNLELTVIWLAKRCHHPGTICP